MSKNLKISKFVSVLALSVFNSGVAAENATTESPALLHEVLNRQFAEIFGSDIFTVRGNGDLVFLSGRQKIDSLDPAFFYNGDVFLKVANDVDYVTYSAEVGLKTRTGNIKNGRAIVDTANLSCGGSFGEFKIGYLLGASDTFNTVSRGMLTGYQGFECSGREFDYFYPFPSDAIATSVPKCENKAARIVWLSPKYNGFTLGFSYAPNDRFQNPFKVQHVDEETFLNARCGHNSSVDFRRHVIDGAIAYEFGDDDAFHGRVGFCYWGAQSSNYVSRKIRNMNIYNIGLNLGYSKFNAAFNYTDYGKSELAKEYADNQNVAYDSTVNYSVNDSYVGIRPGAHAGRVYRALMGYSFGKLHAGCGYLFSKVKLSEIDSIRTNMFTAATQYNFDKMLGIYLEYEHFKTRIDDRAKIYEKAVYKKSRSNNHANLLLLGMKVNW